MRTIKTVLIPVGIGLGILTLLGLAGSALVLFREASAVHPVLGGLVIALLAAAAGLLVLYPLLRILRLPRALVRPPRTTGERWNRYLRRYSRRLRGNPRLLEDYEGLASLEAAGGDALEGEVERAIAHLDRKANATICRHAAAVFTSTAVSQSGRLDAAIVLSAQFRLIKEVAEIYYQRPGPRELASVYANVGGAAFLAGEMQDSELLAILGAPVTAGITGFIPLAGADPLITLLVNSLLDGSANAFLTLRIGILARRSCGVRPTGDKRRMARSASLEAAGLLGSVVGVGASRVAGATRKVVVGRTVKGTTRVAKGMADFGSALFERIGELAGKTGTAAAESTMTGVRFLTESLRFWETIARKSAGHPVEVGAPGEGYGAEQSV